MRRRLIFPLLGIAAVSLAQGAQAQSNTGPAYKASDIVSRFSALPDLGPTRALCIGTESECAKSIAPKPMPASNFDLVVNFEYNSATLTRAAKVNLDEFATALKDPRLGRAAFVVEGHTDGKGSDEFNLDLSARRANAVVEYLTQQGVATARLEAKGYGKLRPVGGDPLAATNRRVETRLRIE
jgi:outer membrane protein OmpA-like peptidoglycan-associated protein